MSSIPPRPAFFGWRVVRAAFVVAVFGWGVGFYGPPVFLHAVQEARGWSVATVSAAVTLHFLAGAAVVAGLARLHGRFGPARVTQAGAGLAALGMLGWALAPQPWLLFAATLLSGAGWAMTGAAAINAIVAPWFARRRPAALAMAFNGASIGGVVGSPLWVALIAALGFPAAAALVGLAMVGVLAWLAARVLAVTPAMLGQLPDGEAADAPSASPRPAAAPLAARPWADRRFATLAAGNALGLFAQIGLVAHLLSLMVPVLGAAGAGLAMGMATACAVVGRTVLGWMMRPGADRWGLLAAVYAVQVAGSVLMLASGGAALPLLAGVALFGLALGNATSLPPLVAQAEFAEADVARVVALVTAAGQAFYAFAPAAFGVLREWDPGGAAVFVAAGVVQAAAAAMVLAGRGRPARG